MARKTIIADDLTDVEIDAKDGVSATVSATFVPAEGEPIELEVSWDLTNYTAQSLIALIESSDLAGFISDMRPLVKLAGTENSDSEIIRRWVKEAHPEIKVGEKGRIPAEVRALYRREVSARTDAGDTAVAGK
jgi:hypothetical protein